MELMSTLVQAWGIGPVRSNTVLLNWLGESDAEQPSSAELWYARTLAGAVQLGQHVVVLESSEASWEALSKLSSEERRIDIWWFEDESSRLMLLLAHLMTRIEDWAEATLRVLVPAPAGATERVERDLARRLQEFRIEAALEVLVEPQLDDVLAASRGAALVFIPLRIEGMRLSDPFGSGIAALLEGLPVVALVAAAQDVKLSDDAPAPEAEEEKEEKETREPAPGEPDATEKGSGD